MSIARKFAQAGRIFLGHGTQGINYFMQTPASQPAAMTAHTVEITLELGHARKMRPVARSFSSN